MKRIKALHFTRNVHGSFRTQLSDLYRSVFALPPWNEIFSDVEMESVIGTWESAPNESDIHLLTHEEDDKVIGFGVGTRLDDYHDSKEVLIHIQGDPKIIYWITELGVDPNYQTYGLGRLLLRTLVDRSTERGFNTIATRTRPDSKAFTLFQKMGFVEVGRDEFTTGGVSSMRAILMKTL